ncbi:hypothetical protein Taro_043640 [Colocasia esculenta]|uniref:EIPR1-like beta-propeller domain-containing protein n=1 Tax=Colocasia esculenta TaxID=4460 RepID=A0A843X134_COLES|nr:hypothetical protein [Colocasia esculenta]
MQGGSTGIVYGGLKYQVMRREPVPELVGNFHLRPRLTSLIPYALFLPPIQARCIADVKADSAHTSFLAGTLSLREENEVHLIRLSPSGAELVCEGLFYHPNEIWDLASCPYDQRVFSTVFASGEAYGAAIWKIPELYGQSNSPQLEQLVSLNGHSFKIKNSSQFFARFAISDLGFISGGSKRRDLDDKDGKITRVGSESGGSGSGRRPATRVGGGTGQDPRSPGSRAGSAGVARLRDPTTPTPPTPPDSKWSDGDELETAVSGMVLQPYCCCSVTKAIALTPNIYAVVCCFDKYWALILLFFYFHISLDVYFILNSVLWWPSGKHDSVISLDEQNLFLWSLDSSHKIAKVQSQESVGLLHSLSGGTWDPHDKNAVAAFGDSFIQCWDLRTMKKTNSIEHSHVRDAEFNPNKQHILATAEDEAGIRLWDLRLPKVPFRELPGHAHWTWAVRHNPLYDQLILSYIHTHTRHSVGLYLLFADKSSTLQSAGTDSTVNLWLASFGGSDDSLSESHIDALTRQINPLLNSYTDYEDSVYGIAWSFREPSLFASLSYDGRVVVESVKSHLPKK